MIKRLVWFLIGTTVGTVLCLWALHTARAKARQLAPSQVAGDLTAGVRSFFDDLRDAIFEGRLAMRERETELRAELERRDGSSTARAALPVNTSLN